MPRMNKSSASFPLLVILGPTASGKSALAVELARKFNGEVVSADSRQVYRDLNVGTGKITRREMKGVRHHLLDVAEPKRRFTVQKYKELAEKAIDDIHSRGKLPILCGGTGFYIDAVVNDLEFPAVKANKKLRARLAKKSLDELLKILEKLDPSRARAIQNSASERNNARRIIRAIEIASHSGTVPSLKKTGSKYDAFFIGLKTEPVELRKRIHSRLLKRLKAGMLAEARRLNSEGLSWKRMEELGLEYRFMARFLQGKTTREETIRQLDIAIGQYARRQMTWFRRNKNIEWHQLPVSVSKLSHSVAHFLHKTRN